MTTGARMAAIVMALLLASYAALPGSAASAPPSGRTLLQRASAAASARGSFHEVYVTDERDSSGKDDRTEQTSNVSFRHQMLRLVIAERVTQTRKGRTRTVFKSRQLALAAGDRGARMPSRGFWLCAAGFGATAQLPPVLVDLHSDHIAAIRNLGETSVERQPVWRVRVTGWRIANAQHESFVADEYISRRDGTLQRESLQTGYTLAGMRVHGLETVDYSRYGMPVRVSLPSHCQEP